MVNYSYGKVYKIEPINGDEGDVYFGSTTKQYLSQRMDSHRKDYKRWKEGKRNYVSSFSLFEKYGLENCKIILLDNVNANSKDEMISKEAYYIRNFKCVNRTIPDRKKDEYIKEYRKEYHIKNKEQIREQRKQFNEANKEKKEINCVYIMKKTKKYYVKKRKYTLRKI